MLYLLLWFANQTNFVLRQDHFQLQGGGGRHRQRRNYRQDVYHFYIMLEHLENLQPPGRAAAVREEVIANTKSTATKTTNPKSTRSSKKRFNNKKEDTHSNFYKRGQGQGPGQGQDQGQLADGFDSEGGSDSSVVSSD
jgi:hypothetical protein